MRCAQQHRSTGGPPSRHHQTTHRSSWSRHESRLPSPRRLGGQARSRGGAVPCHSPPRRTHVHRARHRCRAARLAPTRHHRPAQWARPARRSATPVGCRAADQRHDRHHGPLRPVAPSPGEPVPRTRVVIQSRLNSSRLPGKAMLTIAGMPLIELVARRASRSGHEVVVATSEEPYDERIAGHLSSVGIPIVRGSLDDVLSRFVEATADLAPDDRVVRLTGDNPVADADLVDELLAALDASDHRYGRVDIDQVPEGLGAEAFSVAALREANATTTDAYDREHVTPWLRRTLGELLFVPRGCPDDVHAYRATVDTLGDYVRVSS